MLCDKPCGGCGSKQTYRSENKCRPGTIDVQWSCIVCGLNTHETIADPNCITIHDEQGFAGAASDPTGLIEDDPGEWRVLSDGGTLDADDTIDTELATEPQASSLEPQD